MQMHSHPNKYYLLATIAMGILPDAIEILEDVVAAGKALEGAMTSKGRVDMAIHIQQKGAQLARPAIPRPED